MKQTLAQAIQEGFNGKEKEEIKEGSLVFETKIEEDKPDTEEGNAFGAAVVKAKKAGKKKFKVGGKEYPVKEGDDEETDEGSLEDEIKLKA